MLRRRGCSTKFKNKPSTEAVQNQMKLIQGIIDRNKLPACRIANEDETNIVPCPELLAQYVPPNASRAIDPGSWTTASYKKAVRCMATPKNLTIKKR